MPGPCRRQRRTVTGRLVRGRIIVRRGFKRIAFIHARWWSSRYMRHRPTLASVGPLYRAVAEIHPGAPVRTQRSPTTDGGCANTVKNHPVACFKFELPLAVVALYRPTRPVGGRRSMQPLDRRCGLSRVHSHPSCTRRTKTHPSNGGCTRRRQLRLMMSCGMSLPSTRSDRCGLTSVQRNATRSMRFAYSGHSTRYMPSKFVIVSTPSVQSSVPDTRHFALRCASTRDG